jgi:hypothetical protein
MGLRELKLNHLTLALIVAYALVLSAGAAANIWINYLGKGSTWDIYPAAESFWVLCSVVVVLLCGSMRRLVIAVIALLFLDSWVDLCAMGEHSWWAGPPLLTEWKWNTLGANFHTLIYGYWAFTWAIQVPLRCIAMARAVSGSWGRQCFIIALGLNLIWFTAPQDVLYHFVWWGIYDANHPYFSYLPPEGFWNLWNMLLLRVPIGVAVGALLVSAGRKKGRWSLLVTASLWFAISAIGLYAAYFLFIMLRAVM